MTWCLIDHTRMTLNWLKVILHQFWGKTFFSWKFNLEYGGTFTKLFMHVSSRNMFPTIRNLQIRVHVYRPPLLWKLINFQLFCSDDCRSWPRDEKKPIMDAEVSTHTFLTMIIGESVCFMSCEPFFWVQLFLCGTHGIYFYLHPTFFSSTE